MEISPLGSSTLVCSVTIIASPVIHFTSPSLLPPSTTSHPTLGGPPPELLSDMLILLLVASALLFHNALASTIGDRSSPQVVLSGYDSPTTISDALEEVDISEGWADPRINGGRFLDVCRILYQHPRDYNRKPTTVHRTAPRRAAQYSPLGAI
jgi:hypothetical protein